MSIKLKQFDGSLITPKDDAITYDLIIGQSGIISGCELSFIGANKVVIASGRGIIKGRIFVVEEETISCQMTDAGSMPGRIYIHINLSDLEAPIKILSVAAAELPELEQDADCNETNGIYEIELATYTASEVAISNLAATYNIVKGMDVLDSVEEIDANTESGKIAGALAIKKIKEDVNSNLIDIYVGDDGKLHKVQDGADSVLPFKRAQTSFSGSSQFYYRSSDKVNHTWLSINFDATSYKKVTITSTYPYQIYMDGTSAGWKTASGTYDISDANTLGVTIRTGNATANDSQIYSGNWSVDFK